MYQMREGPPVARRPFRISENAALFRAAGRCAAAASAAARGARRGRGDRAESGDENEQQREQGLLHGFSPRSFRSGVLRFLVMVEKRKEAKRPVADVSVPKGHVHEMERGRRGDLRKVKRGRLRADRAGGAGNQGGDESHRRERDFRAVRLFLQKKRDGVVAHPACRVRRRLGRGFVPRLLIAARVAFRSVRHRAGSRGARRKRHAEPGRGDRQGNQGHESEPAVPRHGRRIRP